MIKYICRSCNQEKVKFKTNIRKSPTEWKYVDDKGIGVSGKLCNFCYLDKQKEKRQKTNNLITKRYEKTKKGFLMRTYRNMKSRVLGIQAKKAHLYKGKDLLDREDFYSWALNNDAFHDLYKLWEDSNYDRRLTPSIDRIDSSKGYVIENIHFIEHWKNSKKGADSRHKRF